MAEGVREQIVTKISILTGKVSKACIVRRNVLGCLSRDGGARGELRCVMSREREETGGGGGEEGGGWREGEREGEKTAGWKVRTGRVLEDNRHAGCDLHVEERPGTQRSAFSLSACHLPRRFNSSSP